MVGQCPRQRREPCVSLSGALFCSQLVPRQQHARIVRAPTVDRGPPLIVAWPGLPHVATRYRFDHPSATAAAAAVDPSTTNNDPFYTDPYTDPEPYEDPDSYTDPTSTPLGRPASTYSIAFEPRATGETAYAVLAGGTTLPAAAAAAEDGASPPLVAAMYYSTAAESGHVQHAPQYDTVGFVRDEAAVGAPAKLSDEVQPVYHYQVADGAGTVA